MSMLDLDLGQVLHCVNHDVNPDTVNGSEPILCICVYVIKNTMLMLKLTLTQTQTLRVNKA